MLVVTNLKKMANTGVLPFVRGVDFTKNDFSVSKSCVPNHSRRLVNGLMHPRDAEIVVQPAAFE